MFHCLAAMWERMEDKLLQLTEEILNAACATSHYSPECAPACWMSPKVIWDFSLASSLEVLRTFATGCSTVKTREPGGFLCSCEEEREER